MALEYRILQGQNENLGENAPIHPTYALYLALPYE